MKETNILKKTELTKEESEQLNQEFNSNNSLSNIQTNSNHQAVDYNKKTIASSIYDDEFDWVNKNNMKTVEQFSLFPLFYWKTLTYDKLDKNRVLNPKTCYQECVNDILEYDVFRGENFNRETLEYKAINDREISPNFYIDNIDSKKFIKIIEDRPYMFKTNYKIPSNFKKICIIGEIKTSNCRKKKSVKEIDYLTFSKKKNTSDTLYMVMYIFDKNYKDFYSSNLSTKDPVIYGYVPKLHKEDCYTKMKIILEWLKANKTELQKERFDEKVKETIIKKKLNDIALMTENHFLKIVIFIYLKLNFVTKL